MDEGDKFRYVILPEKSLIINSCAGEISFDEIIHFQILQSKDKDWNRNYNVLTDLRQAKMGVKEINEQTLSKFPSNLINKHKKRKSAHLTNSPNHVVFHTLLDLLKNKDVAVQLRAFSTIESALKWLEVDSSDKEKINGILIQLFSNRGHSGEK